MDAEGAIHHVIVRGIEQRRIFDDDGDRRNFVSRLAAVAVETETTIYAWALLPNHAHALIRSGPSGISKFMRRLLTGYAVNYNRRHDRQGAKMFEGLIAAGTFHAAFNLAASQGRVGVMLGLVGVGSAFLYYLLGVKSNREKIGEIAAERVHLTDVDRFRQGQGV